MAVKERGRERGAILRRILEEREVGWGWGIVRKKRGEDGRRWTAKNRWEGVEEKARRQGARMKKRRNSRKEAIKICPLSPDIFCLHKYKLKNFFCRPAHTSPQSHGVVLWTDFIHEINTTKWMLSTQKTTFTTVLERCF